MMKELQAVADELAEARRWWARGFTGRADEHLTKAEKILRELVEHESEVQLEGRRN